MDSSLESIYGMIDEGNICHSIINTDFKTICLHRKKALKNILSIEDDVLKEFESKLERYRFIDGVNELTYGGYIRWINFNNENKLTIGGYICDIMITTSGVIIKCKNRTNRMFQLNMSNCIIFQMITEQEHIVLSTLEHLIKRK